MDFARSRAVIPTKRKGVETNRFQLLFFLLLLLCNKVNQYQSLTILLMLGRVQTCLTLLSLNRSLDKRLQFLGICRSGEDGAVAINEVHGTSSIVGSVLAPHTVLVVQFQ